MPETVKLTAKQQKFVDSYDGDLKEAAEKAGLSYGYCRRLVTKSHILQAIRERQETEIRPKLIAKRQQRQEFWTQIMNDTTANMKDRLRASELLGRSEADFTENLNHRTPDGCGVLAVPIRMSKEQWKQFAEHQQSQNKRPIQNHC